MFPNIGNVLILTRRSKGREDKMKRLLFVTCLVLWGCGYTFQGSGSVLPSDVKRVYVPFVENNSSEPGLATVMTEALRDSFERYGVVRIVDSAAQADAVLRAKILSVKSDTQTSTSNTDTALQNQLVLRLAAELRRTSGAVLWRNSDMQVAKTYGAQSGVVVTTSAAFASSNLDAADLGALDTRELSRGQQQEALSELAEDAAQDVYDRAVAPDF